MPFVLGDIPLLLRNRGGQKVVEERHCIKQAVSVFGARDSKKRWVVVGPKLFQLFKPLGKVFRREEEVEMPAPQEFAVLLGVGGL